MTIRPFSALSIRGKLIWMSMTISAAAVLLSVLVFSVSNVLTAKRSIMDRLSAQANIIGVNSASPLVFYDDASARKTLSALKAEASILAAALYTNDSMLFADYTRRDVPTTFLPAKLPEQVLTSHTNQLQVFQPVELDGEVVGTVYLQADLMELYTQLRYQFFVIAIVLLVSFLLALVLSSKLQGRISDPILHLAKIATSISRDKNYGIRVKKFSEDEIGTLMDAFNDMLVEIQERDERLERRAADLQKLNEQLRHQAYHDILTGLPNRDLFNDRLTHAIRHVGRSHYLLAVLFLDMDRFKNINDTLGHTVGDALLKLIATRLQQLVRKDDTVARLGGDEFIILLNTVSSTSDASEISQKIIKELELPFHCLGRELHITTSIGIAICPNDGQDTEILMRNADTAMYHAKSQGGNSYTYYDKDMHAKSLQRLEMENSLRRALLQEEFVMYYQPLCAIDDGCIVGVEALIRWQNGGMGMVSPADFIPILEETGLIIPVGEWIIKTVCAQARAWKDAGLPAIKVSINLSPRQFGQSKLAQVVREIINETGLPAESLTLEITETVIMEDSEAAVTALQDLSSMGISLAIDDFGTGYSSLSYLKRFPIDAVKIDQSFVRDLTTNPDDAAIVKATIAMTHALNLKVIAEGVETDQQLKFLRECGCDIAQGYLFDKPLPNDQLVSRLSAQLLKLSS